MEIGITQAELARRAGLTQPTINDLIKGKSRSSAHLHRIAAALRTTPAWLAEETDDPQSDAVDNAVSPEELDWLDMLRGLEPGDRGAVLTLTRSLANSARSPTVHAPGLEYHAGRPEEQRLGGGKAQHTKKQGSKERAGQAGAVR